MSLIHRPDCNKEVSPATPARVNCKRPGAVDPAHQAIKVNYAIPSKAIVLLIAGLFSACNESPAISGKVNQNTANTKPSVSPTPSATPEIVDNDVKSAVRDFIAKHYDGWTPQGIVRDCFEYDEPCELHLTKGKNEKVVTLIAKKFGKENGHFYWLVYEASKQDLAKAKINKIKEQTRQETLDNLSRNECAEICAD